MLGRLLVNFAQRPLRKSAYPGKFTLLCIGLLTRTSTPCVSESTSCFLSQLFRTPAWSLSVEVRLMETRVDQSESVLSTFGFHITSRLAVNDAIFSRPGHSFKGLRFALICAMSLTEFVLFQRSGGSASAHESKLAVHRLCLSIPRRSEKFRLLLSSLDSVDIAFRSRRVVSLVKFPGTVPLQRNVLPRTLAAHNR